MCIEPRMCGNTVKKSYWRRTGVRRAYIVAGVVLVYSRRSCRDAHRACPASLSKTGDCDPVRDRLGGGQGGLRRPGGYRYRKVTRTAVSGMLDSSGDERHTYF